jgi:hypothetical protein
MGLVECSKYRFWEAHVELEPLEPSFRKGMYTSFAPLGKWQEAADRDYVKQFH